MKSSFKHQLKEYLQTKWLYKALSSIFNLVDRIHFYRMELEEDLKRRADFALVELFREKRVMNGPFKGLSYSGIKAHGSQYYPKLLGSYEEELHNYLEITLEKNPDLIIDIGCAEGYYAVGLAYKLKRSKCKVIAIDNDIQALDECKALAHRNKLSEKIILKDSFNNDDLQLISESIHPLIICDCEGCEDSLFTKDNISNFRRAELIVELHEFIVPNIEDKLVTLFQGTHLVKVVKQRRRSYNKYSQLQGLNYYQKRYLVNERRPIKMKWLFMQPKNEG